MHIPKNNVKIIKAQSCGFGKSFLPQAMKRTGNEKKSKTADLQAIQLLLQISEI